MDRMAFEAARRAEGFTEFTVVEREANGGIDSHTHPFEATGLILDGELVLETSAGLRSYRPGDVFHLDHAEPHVERYGPQGARYLVARR